MCVDPRCGAAHDRSDEPRTHARAGPTPHRRFHKLRRGLQSGGAEKQLVLSSSERLKPGQNSPCTGKTARIPRFWASRGNFITEMPQRPCAWRILSRTCPEVRALGEFCHGNAPTSVRLANFVPDDAPKPLRQARSIRPSAVRSHVNPLAHTSTGYSIDGQAPHTGPARPGCGARGRWRGLAGLQDRSLRTEGSRVAISRAGRRPRAHTAARPWPRAHTAARPWPRAHTAARRLHEHITRPRPVTRPRPRE